MTVWLVLWGIAISSLPALAAERLEESKFYLGTTVRAEICYGPGEKPKAEQAMASVWQKFAAIHEHMNAFDPASDVAAVNAADGSSVAVHDDVYALLARSKEYARITGGVFDVTVGPLMALWQAAGRRDALPSAEEILEAKKMVDASRIELLPGGRVRLPPGMKIDLGGDASGFAADEAARVLRQAGFNDFLVDAGGEIYAAGQACAGRPWHVGVKDPVMAHHVAGVVVIRDAAVSTSGSYEKYVTIKGGRWPHIVNPLTGYPERGVVSATVMAPVAADADALSTALCVLGPGPGLRLIDSLGQGYAGMVITEGVDGRFETHATAGYVAFRMDQ